MNLPNKALLIAGLLAGAGSLTTVEATPILGGSIIVATTGDVIARFEGHTAGYTSELFLSTPGGTYSTFPIFNNQITPVGTTVNLGSFAVGTELVFMIHVITTGLDFYSGPGSRNSDGLAHAGVETISGVTYVGFEDLLGGGDRDYDDLNFSFSNTRATTSVPDAASTLTLLSLGLTGLVGAGRMTRKND